MSVSWGKIIYDAGLTGMPAMIACFAQMRHFDAGSGTLELELPAPLQVLRNGPACERMVQALKKRLGEKLVVIWHEGPAENAPVKIARREHERRFTAALQLLRHDPDLNAMLTTFDAKIDVDKTGIDRRAR